MLLDAVLASAAALFGGLVVLGWGRADRRDEAVRRQLAADPRPRRPLPTTEPGPYLYEGVPESFVLAGPPLVGTGRDGRPGTTNGPVPLRDWLLHLHPDNRDVWMDVVGEFCDTVAADPEVAAYFPAARADRDALKTHFLAMLMMVTGDGLTVGTVNRMRQRHATVRNDRGAPISPQAYDATATVLVGVLRSRGVPERTLRQVVSILEAFRTAVATPAGSGHPGEPSPRIRHASVTSSPSRSDPSRSSRTMTSGNPS